MRSNPARGSQHHEADIGADIHNAITWAGVLGFNSFAEIGGGLQVIAPNIVRGVQGATVRASAILGVTGWLVSAALDF